MASEDNKESSLLPEETLIAEQRRTPRYDSVNLVWYEDFDEHGADRLQGIGSTVNISTGGICIKTGKPLKPSVKLSLELFTKFERKIRAIAEVSHASVSSDNWYVTGLKFVAISRVDLQYLRDKFPPEAPQE